MAYYSTTIGTATWAGPLGSDILYFANANDLTRHLQAMYNCTADEIELSAEWNICGHLFHKHDGSIDAQFCENHNNGKIDFDLELELGDI